MAPVTAAQLVQQWNAETEKWLFVHVILQLLDNYIPLFYSLFQFYSDLYQWNVEDNS